MTLTWPAHDLPEDLAAGLVGTGAPYELVTEAVLGATVPVFARRPTSLVDVLRSGAAQFAGRPFLVFGEHVVTFDSVVGLVARVAAGLRADFGVGPGDRVAVASANRLEYALTFWATTALGAITVALNGWWTGPEMAHAVELTRPRVVFADQRRLDRLIGEELGETTVVRFEDRFEQLATGAPAGDLPCVEMREDDPFVILFTSGTTGRAKGVPLSHRNVIHFALAVQLRAAELRARAEREGGPVGPVPLPCTVNASPLFHVSGLTCSMAISPLTGLTTVYPPPGRWDPVTHLRLTEQHAVTGWSLVPTQLWRLLDSPELDRFDLTSLRSVTGGSTVWPPELLARLEARLPGVRPGLALGYGMTETNGLGTTLSGTATYAHPDAVGVPSATASIEIREPVTRRALGENEVGEIAIRSASNFAGYWEDPEATSAVVDQDRWYHTGDLGYHREGVVYLAGRRSDLIIRGGENVYPAEVERRLGEHPAIADAAVVGVPHATLGQEVKAYVVLRADTELTPDDVRAFCARSLAGFKVPTYVEVVPDLPRNASGKVLKRQLVAPDAARAFVEE